MGSLLSFSVIVSALELGFIYALVALALFFSYSILNIADLSTDGCFTLGCAVGAQVAIMGHPILALFAAMAAACPPRSQRPANIRRSSAAAKRGNSRRRCRMRLKSPTGMLPS